MKLTQAYDSGELVIVSDFSPPRGADPSAIEDAAGLDADFICVAYSPGKAVRVDSAALAAAIKLRAGRDVVFNLATRDMNRLAIQNHLLGAQVLGLENLLIIQGDPFTERDLERVKPAGDYTTTGLIAAVHDLNQGVDFRGLKLRTPTDFCIGAAIDLGHGVEREARLAARKAEAGAHFFLTQPIFDPGERERFLEAFRAAAGHDLEQPVFWGLQVMARDGVSFSNVPAALKQQLDAGRDGAELALELLHAFRAAGIHGIYIVPPIMRGGARDYPAAQRVIAAARTRAV
jgi:5,10-methylenetetrahydrofolate reductase